MTSGKESSHEETRRQGDGETGERRDGETGRREMGRRGEGEMGRRGDGSCGFAAPPCGKATPFRARPPKKLARLRLASLSAAIFTTLAIVTTSLAQQIGEPTRQHGVTLPRGVYAIRNAHIVTVSGPDIDNGTIVIRDGKIEAVGAGVSAPSGAQTIDARGLWVYPGMIDAATSMGLVEVGQGAPGTVDTAEVGDLNPNAKAIISINPHSAHIAVTRVDGVTSAVSMPLGGLISGQAAIINLVGTSPLEMAVVPYAALVINYPRAGGGGGGGGGFFIPDQPPNLTEALAQANRQLEQIRKMLRDAEAYGRAQEAYAKGQDSAASRSECAAGAACSLCARRTTGDLSRGPRN